jgi:hypothetical protein
MLEDVGALVGILSVCIVGHHFFTQAKCDEDRLFDDVSPFASTGSHDERQGDEVNNAKRNQKYALQRKLHRCPQCSTLSSGTRPCDPMGYVKQVARSM